MTYVDVASSEADQAMVKAACASIGAAFVAAPANKGRLDWSWLGIARSATAPLIHIGEGDDLVEPGFLAAASRALNNQPDAAFAFGNVRWIDGSGFPTAECHTEYIRNTFGTAMAADGRVDPRIALRSGFAIRNPILTLSSTLWRHELLIKLLEENASRFAALDFAFDWLLYAAAFEAGRGAVFAADTTCLHRQHEQSFAARTHMDRHWREVRRLHRIVPAASAEAAAGRRAYLQELRCRTRGGVQLAQMSA